MVQLAGTKALVRDACERKLALEKLVLTFSLFFLLNSFALEFTIAHPPPPRLRQCVWHLFASFKRPALFALMFF